MKRASYREAISVIALNDEPTVMSADAMTAMASVLVVAAIFDVTTERVARDVVKYRETHHE